MAWLWLVLAGCGGGCADPDPELTVTNDPCAAGTWEAIDDPSEAVHVQVTGTDAAAGTATDPVQTPAAAVELALDQGLEAIVLGPGTHRGGFTVGASSGELVIAGCDREQVVLEGSSSSPAVVFAGASGAVLTGLTIEGGDRAIVAAQQAHVVLRDVEVLGALGAGVVGDGPYTVVELESVAVTDVTWHPVAGDAEVAYGLVAQDGAELSLLDVEVTGAGVAGVVVSDSVVSGGGVSVVGVEASDQGRYGRGIQVQGAAVVDLTDVRVSDVHDAGVWLQEVEVGTLSGLAIDDVLPGVIPSSGEETGDGLVVLADSVSSQVELSDATVRGAARAGVVVQGAHVDFSGTPAVSSHGHRIEGASVFTQLGGSVAGDVDAVELDGSSGLEVLDLDDGEPLPPVELSDLGGRQEVFLADAEGKVLGMSAGDGVGVQLSLCENLQGGGDWGVLVGVPGLDSGGEDAGGAHPLLGPIHGVDVLGTDGIELAPVDDPGAGFGSGVACGDLSGDGVSDFALGGHFSSASGEESGAVLIWDGPKGELGTESDRSILGVEPFGWFGIRLAIYPQDGPDALAVGASRTESDGTVYLLDGDVDGEQDATRVEIARVEGSFADGSGTTLVVEDLDGDGTSDLVLGSWRAAAADGGDSGGQVAVYFGPLSGSVAGDNADLIARGETAGHYAGNAIAAGDLDGDGTLELLVGAPEAGTSGSVYVVDATSSGAVSLAEATAVLAAEEGLALGEVVAVVGDVDGDGLADVALGLPNLQGDVDEEGGALVFLTPLAGAVSTADAALHVIGEVVGDGAGSALLWYQDQDDPTESALLVGAFRDAESATDAGAVYQQRLSLD